MSDFMFPFMASAKRFTSFVTSGSALELARLTNNEKKKRTVASFSDQAPTEYNSITA